jgi:hypothetical protein
MADHILQHSNTAAAEAVVLVVLRELDAAPGALPCLEGSSEEHIAAGVGGAVEAGFIEDYVLTANGRAFLEKLPSM